MDLSFLTGCAGQFWRITSGVGRALGLCLGGGVRPATLPQELVMAAHRRVMRAQRLLLALMARVTAGVQRGGWRRTGPVAVRERTVSQRVEMVLPRRLGWLVQLVGYEAAGRASQLAHLLEDPEMVALVRDVPQARRILSPLCRMLGVECAGLREAPRVRVRKAVPADVRAEAVWVVPERIGYRPSAKWPRGVISRRVVRLKPG